MKLIDRLTVGQRLILMTLVFLLPASVMLWLIAATIQKDIDFATWEKYGNAYQRPIQKVLENISPYAWARATNTDKAAAEANINEGFAQLQLVQKELGEKLQVTEQGLKSRGREAFDPAKLQERWEALRAAGEWKTADAVALATDLKGLLLHTGDTSNLILDPDLDSYYLMDVTLLALPQTQGRLISTQWDTFEQLGLAEIGTDDKIKLAVNASMFAESDRGRIAGDVDTVLKEDKNFYGVSDSLKPALTEALTTYAATAEALENALKGAAGETRMAQSDFKKLALDFNTQSFAFWNKGVDELDKLLDKRIAFLQNKRTTYIGVALIALVLAVGVAMYLSGTIRRVLKNIMDILSNNAKLLAKAGADMQSQADQVARAAHEQVTSIEKTAAFMEEISSIIKQNEEFASQSRENALKALQSATQSKQSTEELHQSTLAVDTVLEQMQTSMSEIRAASESIAHILRSIDEIAFQTNILALNAAVEAARAGEAGAGFSVVADEVRKLAHRSASAADETSKLIKASIEKTETGVEVNNKVSKQLRTIAERTKNVTGTIQKTLDEITPLDQKMEHLANAAHEQSSGVSELASSINSIDRMSKENLANSDELGKAAEFLKTQHTGLRSALTELEVLTGSRVEKPEEPSLSTPRRAHDREVLTFK